jgi:hypothetical protein
MGLFLIWKNHSAIKAVALWLLFISPLALLFNLGQFASRTDRSVFSVYWASPSFIAEMLPNEMLCWTWIIIIPLALYCLYKYRNALIRIFALTGIITPALMIPLAHFTVIMPRYAVLVSPLILIVAMYPVSVFIDNQKTINKKIVIFVFIMFACFLFNYGSILEWTTFNVCPYMTATGAAAP